MADPRDIAQDKKVHEEKKHQGEEILPGAVETPQPGKKPRLEKVEKETGEAETYQQHSHHHQADETPE